MRPSISIRGSVCRSVRRSVRNQLFSKSENEGFSSWILSGKPRNIIEMSNCISIGNYACWSVRLSILKVEKTVERTHLLVDQTCLSSVVPRLSSGLARWCCVDIEPMQYHRSLSSAVSSRSPSSLTLPPWTLTSILPLFIQQQLSSEFTSFIKPCLLTAAVYHSIIVLFMQGSFF